MLDIRTQLLRAEDELLLASSSGSLEEFENEWSRISYEIMLATKEKRLPEDIQKLAKAVSTRIYTIASSFLNLNTISHNLTTSFLDNIISPETPSHGQNPAPSKLTIPPYIPLAYAWLIDNLHCPYPSTSMRNSLAEKSGSSRKAIDAWFIDVRKRIGWNALRRTRFGGKKDEIIRAATLFHCENKSDDSSGLEFASIEAAARDLYADKLRPSALVSRFTETGKGHRPSQKDDSAPALPRPHTTNHSPSSSSAPSSPYPTTPLSKRTRSSDEIEPESLDLTHSFQRPLKRQRLISKPSSSRRISGPPSSSLRQSPSTSFSESHSFRPQTSQWPISGGNSSQSHQVSKQASSAQEASMAVKFHKSSSSDPPHLQSTSGSDFYGTSGVPNWPFNPEIVQPDALFGSWDSTTECEVATFDFSTWSPESLNQTELSLPLHVPSSGAQMSFPQPSIASNAFTAPPSGASSDGTGSLNSIGPFSDELLEIFDFFPPVPSKAGLAIFPTSLPLYETGYFDGGLGSNFDNDNAEIVEPSGWDIPDNIQDFLTPLAQQPAATSESESATNLSGDDKIKKLKLLADLKEYTHRLEAEIAVM